VFESFLSYKSKNGFEGQNIFSTLTYWQINKGESAHNVNLSAHACLVNPLSCIVPYFIVLLCLTPHNFIHQQDCAVTQWVNSLSTWRKGNPLESVILLEGSQCSVILCCLPCLPHLCKQIKNILLYICKLINHTCKIKYACARAFITFNRHQFLQRTFSWIVNLSHSIACENSTCSFIIVPQARFPGC
jgi:hypothetical protein